MAKYTGSLTDKQKEMLKPLEAEVKEIMKEKDRLGKIRAFKLSLGFEENKETREKLEALEERHAELSEQINKIYGAQAEMVKHMKVVLEEVKKIDWYCEKYGFVVEGRK